MTHSNIPAAAVEAAMEAFAEVIERGPGLQYPIRAALAAALPLIPIAGGEPISDPKIWGGRPTPAEAISLLRAHARKANLPPGDNNFDDAANVIERLSVAPAVGQEPVAKRWLIEEHLAAGAIRWEVVEHEYQARETAAELGATVTLTPLYTHPAPDHRVDAVETKADERMFKLTEAAYMVLSRYGNDTGTEQSKSDLRRAIDSLRTALATLHPAKEG